MALCSESSDDSTPSPHTTRPQPCDRCQITTCFSLHDYSASSCPYSICLECGELEDLDAQIAEIHNLLIDLSTKRHDLKRRINRRHDRFTSSLPLELISHIFTLIADKSLGPVFALGGVCTRWRDITLSTPQLWTKVTIKQTNLEHEYCPNIIAQWGSRSSSLPLSLELEISGSGYPRTFPINLYSNILPLLRSQAHRWQELAIRTPQPGPVVDMLLTGLESRIAVDSLTLRFSDPYRGDLNKITMEHPFVPERLDIQRIPLSHIPFRWDRLTHLKADRISADALIHVFSCAHKLEYGLLHSVQEDSGHYPISVSPITNTSIKELNSKVTGWPDFDFGCLFDHLTLPSLEILSYEIAYDDNGDTMDALSAFLDRSQARLREFSFSYFDCKSQFYCGWYGIVPYITSLELEIWVPGDRGERMQDHIEQFSAYARPIVFPCLQELKLESSKMCSESWSGLAEMFPDSDNGGNKDTSAVAGRPLKAVSIRTFMSWDLDQELMRKNVYSRLLSIQESGVALQVFDVNDINVLGPDIELVFDESDEESDKEGSSETGQDI